MPNQKIFPISFPGDKLRISCGFKINFLAVTFLCVGSSLSAADWPMWRYDAEHRAASPENLPDDLQHQWTSKLSPREQVWDDPLNHDLMPYDRVFEPIVLGDLMFVTFNDSDKVVAYNTDDGSESWSFYTDGPVRLPPVGHNSSVFIASDDGFLYCLDAETGTLRWKFAGGPSPLESPRQQTSHLRVARPWRPGDPRRTGILCCQHLALHGHVHLFTERRNRGRELGE